MDKGINMIYQYNMLESCKNFAIKKHDGLCLATEYKNSKTKMLWQCKEKHQWEASWESVGDPCNTWCIICSGHSKPTIEEIQQFAITQRNGLCLSTEYKNNKTNLLWQCSDDHQWEANWNNVKNGSWCLICSGRSICSIKEIQDFIKSKNGLLISTEYKNNKTNLIIKCNKCEYEWEAKWNNIKSNNSWCPNCCAFKTEKLCRNLLEQKLNIKLPKTRFYYDINNVNRFLEFDGYNKEHKIAFEYHGIQHYEFSKHWHGTKKLFEASKNKDNIKEQFAAESDIQLIIIPYTKEKNLEEYITNLVINVI